MEENLKKSKYVARKRRNTRNRTEESSLFPEVDALMKGNNKDRLEAFRLLNEWKNEMSENVEFLWRFAKAHQMRAKVCELMNDLEQKKEHVYQGLEYATKALSLGKSNPEVHKWFAILKGMETDFVSIQQKIENGNLFQKHIHIALEIKPNDYTLHHLLGRFKFELANISWFERKIAASLFGELPSVTYEDAISDFIKAESLANTPWKENKLLLAKCYLGKKHFPLARRWLLSAKHITPKNEEDAANDEEINLLLKSLD